MPAQNPNANRSENVRPKPAVRRPTPPAQPTGVFSRPATGQRPFQGQQQAAQAKTDKATAKLPKAPIAAPPVIRNPTPRQVHAAHQELARSVTAAVGSY